MENKKKVLFHGGKDIGFFFTGILIDSFAFETNISDERRYCEETESSIGIFLAGV